MLLVRLQVVVLFFTLQNHKNVINVVHNKYYDEMLVAILVRWSTLLHPVFVFRKQPVRSYPYTIM